MQDALGLKKMTAFMADKVTGDGSIKLRINQRPNHPGVICSTGESGFSLTATTMGGR